MDNISGITLLSLVKYVIIATWITLLDFNFVPLQFKTQAMIYDYRNRTMRNTMTTFQSRLLAPTFIEYRTHRRTVRMNSLRF
jgi:ABC-type uncharacterized transport system fused permease/ATPase subunit